MLLKKHAAEKLRAPGSFERARLQAAP